ncbi:hypothetical protein N7462_000299 [Penicillium macrosclerotiorum]|uniref:uncharacterized protein n=1 Tax=Penicillium macrosclerotiorum TaxID=303699 RepID=UPI0025499BA8|nr:uncharacterized protein N7462_000299 [Penicillium macrosclerotiorum]KAJ5698294.1 hypothetical protein N7462_000299 [Penicillium macrosclerotiorum]
MDFHDVSKVPRYAQLLKKYKQNLKHDLRLRGQHLGPRKSRDEILLQLELRRMVDEDCPEIMSTSFYFLPPAYTPCTLPFKEMSKIKIRDLSLETHHRGQYLLLRTITPTYEMTAVTAIVEDEDDEVLTLELYNQKNKLSSALNLPEGTILIVKEPYLRLLTENDYGLRVDHLSDIRFLPEFDNLVPLWWRDSIDSATVSATSWKEKGNEYFNDNVYRLAIECYSKALESTPSPELAITTLLNRALVYLKTHQFDAALLDANTALSKSNLSEKALFRKAQALYYLGRFQESCETHQILQGKYPENSMARHEFKRAAARLAEQDSGKYEFGRMALEAKKRQPPYLERGTYIGPVTVRPTRSHGKGLFTKEAVKAGDLLLCEKAFAYAFHDAHEMNEPSLVLNADTNRVTLGTHAKLVEMIAHKIHRNPSLFATFFDLYHGTYEPVSVQEVDGLPIIDTFLAERIISLNGFGCPRLSHNIHIDVSGDAHAAEKANGFYSCGVWCMASHINHSCFSTAYRSFIGDMMIVRATRDLPPNTEITFWYKSPLKRKSFMAPIDLRQWGFKCDCIICQNVRNTDKDVLTTRKRLRKRLMVDLQEFHKAKRKDLGKIEDMIARITDTYPQPASEVPRLALWSPYLSLAALSRGSYQPELSIKFGLKALESIGYVIDGGGFPRASGRKLVVRRWGLVSDGVVRCWMVLRSAYHEVDPTIAAQAEEFARISYKIAVGEDETFDLTYRKLSSRTDELPVATE